MDKMNNQIRNK